MRVISGDRRGFRLKGPAGPGTRPMADKIKGSLFSMLDSLGVVPDRVLDLYAGTGSIGIEAMSRGAIHADFVEQNGPAVGVIRDNLRHTRFTDAARIYQVSVAAFLHHPPVGPPYDLIILDPPYADPGIVTTLELLGSAPLVQSSTVIAIGHSPRALLPEVVGRLQRLRERCHGDSCVSIYELGSDGDEGAMASVEDVADA